MEAYLVRIRGKQAAGVGPAHFPKQGVAPSPTWLRHYEAELKDVCIRQVVSRVSFVCLRAVIQARYYEPQNTTSSSHVTRIRSSERLKVVCLSACYVGVTPPQSVIFSLPRAASFAAPPPHPPPKSGLIKHQQPRRFAHCENGRRNKKNASIYNSFA
jgi:hypothetical protein